MNVKEFPGRDPILLAGCMTILLSSFIFGTLPAGEVGTFSYLKPPENLDGDTLFVSDSVVAMSGKIRLFMDTLEDSIPDTPSIFFIIDNSTTMMNQSIDKAGNRFLVTAAFIDTINTYFPMAEVGLAVFSQGLYYIPSGLPGIFKTVTLQSSMGLDDTGGFVPLMTLDRMYGSQTGYQVLKQVLAVNTTTDAVLLSMPSILASQAGTNINCGFDAAKQSFQTAKYPKKNQFIIFLSDGEPNRPAADPTAFTAATNCPTTFTIYFTGASTQPVPQTILDYTNNCRDNSYSETNTVGNVWAYNNTTSNALMTFLMDNVFSVIRQNNAFPRSITVNSQTVSFWDLDHAFVFPTAFPLIGPITPFNYIVTKGNDDTSFIKTITFLVKTKPGTQMPASTLEIRRWNRDLLFYYNSITPIASVLSSMDSLRICFLFNPGDANYRYTNALIELHTSQSPIDRESITLVDTSGYFSAYVKRSVTDQPTLGNGILETHDGNDSIIAIFRNTETLRLPLDTLRVSIPCIKEETALRFPVRSSERSPTRVLVIGPRRITVPLSMDEPFTLCIYDMRGILVTRVVANHPNIALPSPLFTNKNGLYIITVATRRKLESRRVLLLER